jgi:hypothetical protein
MPSPSPFSQLLHSRKFLVAMLDTASSIILYFVGKYAGPPFADDVVFLIGTLQVPVLAIIYAITAENTAMIRANVSVSPLQSKSVS